MAAGCIAERTLRRRRVFVGFVVSKVATIVTVRIQRPIGSGPSSEGICSENESLDTEEIAVRIVLRSAAFAPTGPHGRFAGDKGTYQYLDLSRFSVLAYRYQHDHALAMGVQGKELDHVIVVKRQTSGTQALGVSGEIHFASQDASLELHCAVSAITEAHQDDLQVCQEDDVHGRLGWQLLVQPQMTRLSAEVSCLQAFEHMAVTVVYVGPGIETLDRKSTRLNSSHPSISYAVFCLKKKKTK